MYEIRPSSIPDFLWTVSENDVRVQTTVKIGFEQGKLYGQYQGTAILMSQMFPSPKKKPVEITSFEQLEAIARRQKDGRG